MMLSAVAVLSLVGLFHAWRRQSEQALRLDHCAGQAATRLRTLQNRLEELNTAIRLGRKAVALALVTPGGAEAAAAARQALIVAAGAQDTLRTAWEAQARLGPWLSRCKGDLSPLLNLRALPDLPWRRLPPDLWGPQPLEWPPELPRRLQIKLIGRHSRAGAEIGVKDGTRQWNAQWKYPSTNPLAEIIAASP